MQNDNDMEGITDKTEAFEVAFSFSDLKDRVVVLTGAANGIGRVLALGLAGQGCRLILLDKDARRLKQIGLDLKYSEDTQKRCADETPVLATLLCDLSQPKERKAAALQAELAATPR